MKMTLDEAIKHCVDVHASCQGEDCAELHLQLATWLKELRGLREVVEFYADPENYHGIAFFFDPPCGGFADDFDEDHGHPHYDRPMPGKLARKILDEVSDD
jgi:hypothetical protein